MGFSFKIAPGIRVRSSRGGLRASIGPRAARVHVGGHRTGVSTGIGPLSLYGNVGGRRRTRRPSGPSKATIAAQQRQLARAAKVAEASELVAAFDAILSLHRQFFDPVEPPVAQDPAPVDEAGIRRQHEHDALAGIGVFKRAERAQARQAAEIAASAAIRAEHERTVEEQRRVQAELDERWKALCGNDPDAVLATLSEAFEDNEAPAAAVGVDGSEVGVVVLVPGLEVVPERMPETTAAGNLSMPKLSKAKRADYYKVVVCGHLLATIRETCAVAPGITSVRAAVIRMSDRDAYGKRRLECLLAARFARAAMDGVLWDQTDAARIVKDISTDLLLQVKGQSAELGPLDLSGEPELALLLDRVDFDDDEESDEFDVILEASGSKKIQVIKEVRALTTFGLKEAKDLVDNAPGLLLSKVSKETAEQALGALERAGATITVRPAAGHGRA